MTGKPEVLNCPLSSKRQLFNHRKIKRNDCVRSDEIIIEKKKNPTET